MKPSRRPYHPASPLAVARGDLQRSLRGHQGRRGRGSGCSRSEGSGRRGGGLGWRDGAVFCRKRRRRWCPSISSAARVARDDRSFRRLQLALRPPRLRPNLKVASFPPAALCPAESGRRWPLVTGGL
ncbi:hypothetical protein D1007_56646 [Hordeum vulgare]|uniref:Predicted protein n=1 Tax=Hordeum vulgare subsp. vulgare TaxID=112509 RepID=F2DHV8_HORVV|nr:hypothetical protein D1007_56646 [Hordeum vulgare]BAJ94679.1 predicted protein [Hordeum vulgare subsp. vulgare]